MSNKTQEKDPFSEWTIEWDHLIWVTPKVRNAIMDVTGIHDYANDINKVVDQVLINNNKKIEKIDELEKSENKDPIENILQSNHPRSNALYDYVTSSEENKQWYLKNIENIKLVDDWIEILWDVFYLEDEKAPDWEWITNNEWYTYFDFYSARKHAELQWKRVPSNDDWRKYKDFLPRSDKNRVNFLTQVLWLSFAGTRYWSNNYYYNSTYTHYWSSTPYASYAYYSIGFNADNIIASCCNRYHGFSLRCLKN